MVTANASGQLSTQAITNGLWSQNGSDIFYNSGNVGIGTSNSTARLTVDGNEKIYGNLLVEGSTGYSPYLYLGTDQASKGSLAFYDKNVGPLLLPEAHLSYFMSENRFVFLGANNSSIDNAAFSVDLDFPASGPASDGFIVIGKPNDYHLTLDHNEIQAKGTQAYLFSTLYVNPFGGDVLMVHGDTFKVGIGNANPRERLDVSGKIALSQSVDGSMIMINGDYYNHGNQFQDMGSGGAPFLVASREGISETSGIYGDGNAVSIWSPGDSQSGQPAAYLYILDEDLWPADNNPYNEGALKAYVSTSGVWTVSDQDKKENIEKVTNALDRISMLNAYKYDFKRSQKEIEKNSETHTAVGIMAQELKQVIPEAVQMNDEGDHFVNYDMISPILIEAIKEQQAIIDHQSKLIKQLEYRLTDLEK
jgi:hypothetical protein